MGVEGMECMDAGAFIWNVTQMLHVPWKSKDYLLNGFFLKDHFFSRDLQSTIPGAYYFNGLWPTGCREYLPTLGQK